MARGDPRGAADDLLRDLHRRRRPVGQRFAAALAERRARACGCGWCTTGSALARLGLLARGSGRRRAGALLQPASLDEPARLARRAITARRCRRRPGRLRVRPVHQLPAGKAMRTKRLEPWRDTGVEIGGPAVAELEHAFAQVWDVGRRAPLAEADCRSGVDRAGRRRRAARDRRRAERGGHVPARPARSRRSRARYLWLTDAYFVGTAPYVQALRPPRATASTCACSCPARATFRCVCAVVARGLPAAARRRRARVRVERHDAAREDRGGRRLLGARRLDQPQFRELARQLRTRRRDRGRGASRAEMADAVRARPASARPRSCSRRRNRVRPARTRGAAPACAARRRAARGVPRPARVTIGSALGAALTNRRAARTGGGRAAGQDGRSS